MAFASWIDTAFDVFGVIGAVATVAALGWSIYTFLHRVRTHIKVQVENAFPTYGNFELGERSVSVTAINRNDRPVRVTSAGLVLPDGRDMVILRPPFPGALPTEVPPHDSRMTWVESKALEDEAVDLKAALRGFVRTSTHERFESKPVHLF